MKRNIKVLWSISICMFWFWFVGYAAKPNAVIGESSETKDLTDFVHILESHRNGVLANRNGDKLRTQIITFSFVEGNRAYFCTTNDKPLYAQLIASPYVSYCTFPENFEPVLSLNGKVVFVEDRALKEHALESNSYARRNFRSVDNPLLEVFYIDVEEIETYGSGGPNRYIAK